MTDKRRRVSLTVDDDLAELIEEYRHKHRLPSACAAVMELMNIGLDVLEKEKRENEKTKENNNNE